MTEYERDKAFLGILVDAFFGDLMPDAHPVRLLEATEARSSAQARQGLRLAVNDMVEMSLEWPPVQVAAIDEVLRQAGASTLADARLRHSKALGRIEKRGAIRTETEAYLVKGILDADLDGLPIDRRTRLQAVFEAYEASVGAPS